MTLAAGQQLASYRILSRLGSGGMGDVFKARDTRLERDVAIKVLPEEFTEDEDRMRRFEREAKVLAALDSPNIAGIFDVESLDGANLLILEFVPGETLAECLAGGPLPFQKALDTCQQVADGVRAAHAAGIVHRDLKPANIVLTPRGVVKVLDFGLAKPMDAPALTRAGSRSSADSPVLSAPGSLLGTPSYMSPEQVYGESVDHRADIWAFGCVAFEALTGRRAFEGESIVATLFSVVHQEPDWSLLPREATGPLRELLERCLDKDSAARLNDIADAGIALDQLGRWREWSSERLRMAGESYEQLARRSVSWRTAALLALAAALLGYAVGRLGS